MMTGISTKTHEPIVSSISPPKQESLLSTERNQVLLPSKFITHHPKAGLNPLVDAAAYLFSVTGKLKGLKSYRHLSKLHQELIQEINLFQDAAKTQGYSSEYILVSRYALCSTLDDIIVNTAWGSQGQWDNFSLLAVFNQEAFSQDRFFIILDRIIKDPGLYIHLMEFMYVCLSMGFKGNFRSSEFNNHQLEQVTHSLYKHIRAYHGDFNKSLSPFPIRAQSTPKKPPSHAIHFLSGIIATIMVITLVFVGLEYKLEKISDKAYQQLMHIGKKIVYENLND